MICNCRLTFFDGNFAETLNTLARKFRFKDLSIKRKCFFGVPRKILVCRYSRLIIRFILLSKIELGGDILIQIFHSGSEPFLESHLNYSLQVFKFLKL